MVVVFFKADSPGLGKKIMKVSDVMSRQVDFVRPTEPVERAALLIFGHNIHSVPVCEGKKIVGIVSEKDILQRFFPSVQEFMEDIVHASDFESMEEKAAVILSLPVGKIMSKNPLTIKPDMPILKAHSLMTLKRIGRLPVVDENNTLIGILSKGDVFRSLVGDKLLFTENEDYNDFLSKTYYQSVDSRNRLQYEIPDLEKLFKKHNAKTIIDIGCGTGDHAIELARRGYTIIGTDRSQAMIHEANKRTRGLPDSVIKNLKFIHDDAEKVFDDLKIDFDAILILGNTLSHNPTNYKKLLMKSYQYLSDNGVMVLQVTNFQKILKKQKRLQNFSIVPQTNGLIKEYAFIEFYDPPIDKKTILKTFAILAQDKNRWRWSGIRNSLMAYTDKSSLTQLLKKAGMKNIQIFGSHYDGHTWDYLFRKPFDEGKSDWLNIIATKK